MSIAELVRGVRLVLSGASAEACGGLDNERNGALSGDELIVGVRHALYGCGVLAVPDGVFDANVFTLFSDPFTPAVVRQDIDGTLRLTIDYDVARSIEATGHVAPDGAVWLEGSSVDTDRVQPLTGSGDLRFDDDVYVLEARLSGPTDGPTGMRLARPMHGTPATWGGHYLVTLSSDAGDSTLPLTLNVPPSGFGECDGGAVAGGPRPRFRSGPCLISRFGGFRFSTALLPESDEIVLFGQLDTRGDQVTGLGTWGVVATGETLGTWTAVQFQD